MNVVKQMEAAQANAEEGLLSDPGTYNIFQEIMAGVVEEAMPFRPMINLMDCGGWRADWFVQEPALSVRLIVSAAPGVYPLIFWEDDKGYGVKSATSKALNSYLKALAEMLRLGAY